MRHVTQKEVDVIVPACRYENTRLLPSGRFLYVSDRKFWLTSTYLLDLQTNEKITVKLPKGHLYFLTDSLLYVSSSEEYILDRVKEKQYPIRKFLSLYPEAAIDGKANLRMLAETLQGAEYVFLINDDDTVVALASDFPAAPDDSFITGWFDIPGFAIEGWSSF